MSISAGTYLRWNTATDVTIDGQTVIDPGDASIVRITNAVGSPAVISGIKGGVSGRPLVLINTVNYNITVAHDYDSAANVAATTERIRCESGAFSIIQHSVMLMVYVNGTWRHVS